MAGELPNKRSYTVHIHGSGHPNLLIRIQDLEFNIDPNPPKSSFISIACPN